MFFLIPTQRSVGYNQKDGRHLKKITGKYKTSILEDERYEYSQTAFFSFFLWLGISLVLILVFHFLLFSNLTLILYFLFLPQADMDSLEGNDTP